MDHCIYYYLPGTATLLASLVQLTECTPTECHEATELMTPSAPTNLGPWFIALVAVLAMAMRPPVAHSNAC